VGTFRKRRRQGGRKRNRTKRQRRGRAGQIKKRKCSCGLRGRERRGRKGNFAEAKWFARHQGLREYPQGGKKKGVRDQRPSRNCDGRKRGGMGTKKGGQTGHPSPGAGRRCTTERGRTSSLIEARGGRGGGRRAPRSGGWGGPCKRQKPRALGKRLGRVEQRKKKADRKNTQKGLAVEKNKKNLQGEKRGGKDNA